MRPTLVLKPRLCALPARFSYQMSSINNHLGLRSILLSWRQLVFHLRSKRAPELAGASVGRLAKRLRAIGEVRARAGRARWWRLGRHINVSGRPPTGSPISVQRPSIRLQAGRSISGWRRFHPRPCKRTAWRPFPSSRASAAARITLPFIAPPPPPADDYKNSKLSLGQLLGRSHQLQRAPAKQSSGPQLSRGRRQTARSGWIEFGAGHCLNSLIKNNQTRAGCKNAASHSIACQLLAGLGRPADRGRGAGSLRAAGASNCAARRAPSIEPSLAARANWRQLASSGAARNFWRARNFIRAN